MSPYAKLPSQFFISPVDSVYSFFSLALSFTFLVLYSKYYKIPALFGGLQKIYLIGNIYYSRTNKSNSESKILPFASMSQRFFRRLHIYLQILFLRLSRHAIFLHCQYNSFIENTVLPLHFLLSHLVLFHLSGLLHSHSIPVHCQHT